MPFTHWWLLHQAWQQGGCMLVCVLMRLAWTSLGRVGAYIGVLLMAVVVPAGINNLHLVLSL